MASKKRKKPMKTPKRVFINGEMWITKYVDDLKLDNVGPCNGVYDSELKTISIDRLVTREEKPRVWFHEFIHAIIHENNLNEHGGVDGFVEEHICSSITKALFENFKMQLKPVRKKKTLA